MHSASASAASDCMFLNISSCVFCIIGAMVSSLDRKQLDPTCKIWNIFEYLRSIYCTLYQRKNKALLTCWSGQQKKRQYGHFVFCPLYTFNCCHAQWQFGQRYFARYLNASMLLSGTNSSSVWEYVNADYVNWTANLLSKLLRALNKWKENLISTFDILSEDHLLPTTIKLILKLICVTHFDWKNFLEWIMNKDFWWFLLMMIKLSVNKKQHCLEWSAYQANTHALTFEYTNT